MGMTLVVTCYSSNYKMVIGSYLLVIKIEVWVIQEPMAWMSRRNQFHPPSA